MHAFLRFVQVNLVLGALLPAAVFAQQKTFVNPLTRKAQALSISALVGQVVQVILAASGVVAAIVIILAGLRVIFSQGSEDAIGQGKQAILWAAIGLVVAFGGYVVIELILQQGQQFISPK